ncbi:hypothetical protein BDZ90DRAFT_281701 [Jaminaea rosea]|uniref:DUF7704 domain-containing protein n=1 Tax=Jaminaea rosea TaxID=1569628 RepID=A0A316UIP8_9BASI|nr:hypothetical protein BDZ90DRAFT_281701 [Jaminaea rosea]PWN25100.1 hypothetical protein BDZ90DRAFT_281701 [Jaminaea rosea]
MSQLTPLPAPWYIFFGLLEPVSTLAGAYFALLDTDGFYRDLIPLEMKGSAAAFVKGVVGEATGGALLSGKPSDEARMGLAQLGSCYLLLALVSLFLFSTLRSFSPNSLPRSTMELIIRNYLAALAIADLVHIGVTLFFLPPVGRKDGRFWFALVSQPQRWNGLLAGNVLATLGLFTARSMWFLGVGRGSPAGGEKKRK